MSERDEDAGEAVRSGRRPHAARIYDYVLGGEDHYEADREAAAASLRAWPGLRTSMRLNRSTMHRMARWLAGEAGLDQFLDIGTGIPTAPNLHEVVRRLRPDARVVYVDNDDIVLERARAMLTGTPEGRTAYIHADLRTPGTLLAHPGLRATLELERPVALTAIAVLQFIPDARGLLRALTEPLASGSHLALTLPTAELAPESAELARTYTERGEPVYLRGHREVEELLEGLEPVEPGIVPMTRWHPAPGEPRLPDTATNMYAVIARKP